MKIAGLDLSINSSGIVIFELDDQFNLINSNYMGFTSVKKNSSQNIHHYRKKDFNTYLHQNNWMKDIIIDHVNECEYIAIEDYAYGATGKVFHMAEFNGIIKNELFNLGKLIRLYDPNSIKKFATDHGNCDKLRMYDSFIDNVLDMDISALPVVVKSNGISPTSDVIDAYFIAKLLLLELQLRNGFITLQQIDQSKIEIFNRCTKSRPVNILATDFIGK